MRLVATAGAKGSIILLAILLVTATGCPTLLGPGTSLTVSFWAMPTAGTAPLVVQFYGMAVPGPGQTVDKWTWDFGDGSAAGAGPNPMHTYVAPGTYTVTLTVDAVVAKFRGDIDPQPATVRRVRRNYIVVSAADENNPPIADAGLDQLSGIGFLVTLDGSGSSDPDGDPITYAWAFTGNVPAGTAAVLANATTVNPTFTIDLPGSYEIQLIVSDAALSSAPDTVVITTRNRPPIADAGPDQTRDIGEMATLDGTASYDPDGDTITYLWAFTANIPAGTAAVLAGATTAHPTFTPDMPGSFEVQLIVNDGALNSAPDMMVVNTYDQPPVGVAATLPASPVSVDPNADPIVSLDSSVLYGIPRQAGYNYPGYSKQ